MRAGTAQSGAIGDRVDRKSRHGNNASALDLVRRGAMAKAYYSTVFEQPACDIWKIIRDFNSYPVWVGGAGESRIENGKSGDTVGAVRNVLYQGRQIRQRLMAQSDVERSQTYEFCEAPPLPLTGFQATLRVTPVVDGDRAFIEWWAHFDCDAARRDQLTETLLGWFGKWLESLRQSMEPGSVKFPIELGPGAR
jgi:hypothetical protein